MPTLPELLNAAPIILSLILIEGLLSVDNALAIAAMASRLPEKQRRLALKLGILGAYAFRALALLAAQWIMANAWVKVVGAAYLLYLMCAHLTASEEGRDREATGGKDDGGPLPKAAPSLWATVASIELMDLTLSVDNVVAAIALSEQFWVVCAGVFLGILALRVLAGYCITLIERYPILNSTAFLLVGYVGALLLVKIFAGVEVSALGKFGGIVLIVAATLFYGKNEGLQRRLGPFVSGGQWVMRGIAGSVEAVFWPAMALWRRLRGRHSTE